jgi:tRNA nucleotidyltransferase (CCA-adding enzyme)
LFDGIDLWRRPERLELLLTCCIADLRGRTGFEQALYPQADYLRALAKAARGVDIKALVAQGFVGEAMKEAVKKARLDAISAMKKVLQTAAAAS